MTFPMKLQTYVLHESSASRVNLQNLKTLTKFEFFMTVNGNGLNHWFD